LAAKSDFITDILCRKFGIFWLVKCTAHFNVFSQNGRQHDALQLMNKTTQGCRHSTVWMSA